MVVRMEMSGRGSCCAMSLRHDAIVCIVKMERSACTKGEDKGVGREFGGGQRRAKEDKGGQRGQGAVKHLPEPPPPQQQQERPPVEGWRQHCDCLRYWHSPCTSRPPA